MENPILQLLSEDLKILNLGLTRFAEELEKQEVDVLHINWSPPAGGDPELIELLDDLL